MMQDNYTPSAKKTIENAAAAARDLGHSLIGSEHLLLGILMEKNCVAAKILENRDITFENVRARLHGTAGPKSAAAPEFTPRTKSVIASARFEAQALSHDYVGTEHILTALLREGECEAVKIIRAEGADTELIYGDIREFFSGAEYAPAGNHKNGSAAKNTPVLDRYGKDLTEAAKKDKFDPIIGREAEMERVIQILSRRTKNNPCLIGEPGVGKTAVAEGLAKRITEKNVPEDLIGKRVVTLDLSGMIAGAKYRGEFEERLKGLMDELKNDPGVILFIDELHTIIGAGAAEGAVDAANILKPALARGEIRVIGATTTGEYRKYIEKDAALERRFQSVTVGEPSEQETIEILKGLRDRYEAHHKLEITDGAIEAAARLSKRYINDRFLPDKAIDLIDEAASKARITALAPPDDLKKAEERLKQLESEKDEAVRSQEFEKAASLRDEVKKLREFLDHSQKEWANKRDTAKISIGADDIAGAVTAWTNIPVKQLLKEEAEKLVNLEEALHERIAGQNEAVNAIARAVRRSRAGLGDPKRPSGSFIFLGPTGVGKTEVAKVLSEILFGGENAMIRMDMSEFMEKHSVSKLIGSPPGYVGYDDAGQLTEKIRRRPYSVVLFDEIEKAHPDVFNILLQILEDGTLTDAHGRKADFKNAVVIMTSNVGAENAGSGRLGFSPGESGMSGDRKTKIREALRTTFRPEFLNRIDEIIIFGKLLPEEIKTITEMMLAKVKERVRSFGIDIEFGADCAKLLSEEGFDPVYGARPLRRVIQRKIEDALSLEMLENRIKKGDKAAAFVKDGEIIFKAQN